MASDLSLEEGLQRLQVKEVLVLTAPSFEGLDLDSLMASFPDTLLILCPPGDSIEFLDEAGMALHGWFRKKAD